MSKKTKIEQIQKDVLKEMSGENRQFGYKKTEITDKMAKLGHAKVQVSKVINDMISQEDAVIVILEGEGENMVIGIKESEQPEVMEAEFKDVKESEPEPEQTPEIPIEPEKEPEPHVTEPQTEPETTEQTGQETKPVTEEPEKEPEQEPVEEPKPEEDDIDESLIKQEKVIEQKRKELEEQRKKRNEEEEKQLKKLSEDSAKIFIKKEGLKKLPEGIRADYQLLKSQKTEADVLKRELKDMQEIVVSHLESWKGLAKQAGVSVDVIEELKNQILGRSEYDNGDTEKVVYSDKKGIIPDTIRTLKLYPEGMKRADLVKEVHNKFGYNKGAVNRVLSETSTYVANGTLIQRNIVILEGDRVRLTEKYLKE